MNTQHTPGPWAVIQGTDEEGYPRLYVGIPDTRGQGGRDYSMRWAARHVCNVYYQANPQDEANARLIAAAPDLLAALQTIPDCPDDWEDGHNPDAAQAYADAIAEWTIEARAAIAKAKA